RQAKSVLVALLGGRGAFAGKSQQEAIAKWFALKLMVMDVGSPADAVMAQEDRDCLSQTGRIPDCIRILIVHCGEPGLETISFRASAYAKLGQRPPVEGRPNIQVVTFGIGALLLHA